MFSSKVFAGSLLIGLLSISNSIHGQTALEPESSEVRWEKAFAVMCRGVVTHFASARTNNNVDLGASLASCAELARKYTAPSPSNVPPQQTSQEVKDRNARWSLVLAVVGGATSPQSTPASSSFSSDPYLRAEELRKAGRNEEALQAVNEAIKIEPKRGKLYVLRSGILGNLQHYEDGIADAELGLKLTTTAQGKASAAYNKGFNLASLDRKSEALKAYNLSLKFDPNSEMAHFGKGKLYNGLSMWPESKAALDKALKLDPKHGAAWAYRAEDLFRLGQIQDGMVSAEKAVEFAPTDPRSFQARALGHQLNRRFVEMLADATRVVELDPTRPLAHLMRGKALGLLGRQDDALAEYALETDRKAVEPYLNKVHQDMYGTRIYNCGDTSTEFELPDGPRIDSFAQCQQRTMDALSDTTVQTPPPTAKRTVPGLPKKRAAKK